MRDVEGGRGRGFDHNVGRKGSWAQLSQKQGCDKTYFKEGIYFDGYSRCKGIYFDDHSLL